MKNKFLIFIMAALFTVTCLCSCNAANSADSQSTATQPNTATPTQSVTSSEIPTVAESTMPPDQTDPPSVQPTEANKEPGTFSSDSVYVATATQATQDPTQASASSGAADITSANYFTGVWSPAAAVAVSSGNQVSFADAFGSSYGTYGGSFTVYEDNYFEVGMGAYNEEKSHQGIFTVAGTSLNATYDDGIKDTFDYIANYNGKETVKVKVGEYYVYFSR